MIQIIEVKAASDLKQVKELFRKYYEFLAHDHGLDISYQGIEDELATLPGKFAAPKGRLILAYEAEKPIGCAALRPIDDRVCELKRMFVLSDYRGQGVGKALAKELIQEAREIGYKLMRLDTAVFLNSAIKLYKSLGFQRVGPYSDIPEDIRKIAIFMELKLE